MDEVVRKRIVGAAILILIGIALPVLLSRCMHAPVGEDQAMRVYEIQPSGDIEQVSAQAGHAESGTEATTRSTPAQAGGTNEGNAADTASESIAAATLASESNGGPMAAQQSQPQSQPQREPEPQSAAGEAASAATADATKPTGGEPVQTAEQGFEQSAPSGAWVVQVASFPTEKDARAMAKQLAEAYAVFYTTAQVNGDTWYRVRIGPFDTSAAAKNAAAELRAQGRDTLVVQVD